MSDFFSNSELIDLIDKVKAGKRLEFADGLRLIEANDLLAIGFMADMVRQRKNGAKVYFELAGKEGAKLAQSDEGQQETCATATYGNNEAEDYVNQLLILRETQDKQGGFLTFVPHVLSSLEEGQGVSQTTGFEDIKAMSVARILLDNFEHIRVSGMEIGLKVAQVALRFGADDLGAEINEVMTADELVKLIKAAGYVPVERNHLYEVLREY